MEVKKEPFGDNTAPPIVESCGTYAPYQPAIEPQAVMEIVNH